MCGSFRYFLLHGGGLGDFFGLSPPHKKISAGDQSAHAGATPIVIIEYAIGSEHKADVRQLFHSKPLDLILLLYNLGNNNNQIALQSILQCVFSNINLTICKHEKLMI